jgi:hypothetical protein
MCFAQISYKNRNLESLNETAVLISVYSLGLDKME